MVGGPSSAQAARLVLGRISSYNQDKTFEGPPKACRTSREKLRPSRAAVQQARQQNHCLDFVYDDVLGDA